jgi:voltage-dependent calcium channel L type alpha-1D
MDYDYASVNVGSLELGSPSRKDETGSTIQKKPVGCIASIQAFFKTLVQNPLFDGFILAVIIFNSILIAMADYSHVDKDGSLVSTGSTINTLINRLEYFFTAVFVGEFALKILGLGLFKDKKSYFRSAWNWLDFVIVVTSILSIYITASGVKVLRTFRILRPLKSIKSFPQVALIVTSLAKALLELGDVTIIVGFFVLLFSIIGLQTFSGPYLHTRCRLTPFPVNMSWVQGLDPHPYQCLHNTPNYDAVDTSPLTMTKEMSPWFTPQACQWPILGTDPARVCSLGSEEGYNTCPNGVATLPTSDWRWCGSNYDAWGNYRFHGYTAPATGTYEVGLNWGFTNFDHIGTAVLTVVTTMTASAW